MMKSHDHAISERPLSESYLCSCPNTYGPSMYSTLINGIIFSYGSFIQTSDSTLHVANVVSLECGRSKNSLYCQTHATHKRTIYRPLSFCFGWKLSSWEPRLASAEQLRQLG